MMHSDTLGGHHGEEPQFGIGEIFVGNLDDALAPHLAALEVISHHDRAGKVFEMQEVNHLEEFVAGDMVDDRAVLNGGHE